MLSIASRDENLGTFIFYKPLLLNIYFNGTQIKVIKSSAAVSCGVLR